MSRHKIAAQQKILIADDEPAILTGVSGLLDEEGYQTVVAEDGQVALQILEEQEVDLILIDLKMPTLSGLQLLEEIKQKEIPTEVIIITGQGTISTAVEAIKSGAFDYLTKPIDGDRLRTTIRKALEHQNLILANKKLEARIKQMTRFENLIGRHHKMQQVYKMIEAVAHTTASVIVTGESGTGKELVARAIHQKSGRAQGPFVAINCSAFPRDILENELFGHEKGAFTGALSEKPGCFELANQGSLFLDEVAEMPADTQAKLLRVLEEKKFRRLGGTKEVSVDVRIIAATNRDVREALEQGILREDLYYRLNVMEIKLPPLRERMSDVPLLLTEFLQQLNATAQKEIEGFSADSLAALARHSWPGNIRELKNVVERAVILCSDNTVQVKHLPEEITEPRKKSTNTDEVAVGGSLREIEKAAILKTLKMTNNNKTRAAKILDISLKTLHNKLNRYYLEREIEQS